MAPEFLDKISCCNINQLGRIYNIGNNTYFVFIDECSVCGKPIAEIRAKNSEGNIYTKIRRSGTAAIYLYEKYSIKKLSYNYSSFGGTQAKEYSFSNIRGQIYNDNGIRIATQDEFFKMSRAEINAILNRRFYKSIKS